VSAKVDGLRRRLSDPVRKQEIADLLGISLAMVYDALHRGQIPHRRLGKRRYIVPRESFIRWYLGVGEVDHAASS